LTHAIYSILKYPAGGIVFNSCDKQICTKIKMTFLEAIYGSQYYELKQNGKDVAKGRINGNMFFSVFIILIILVMLMSIMTFSDYYNTKWNNALENNLGYASGKETGKLLAIPLFAIIYFIILKTIRTKSNYERLTNNFMQYPDDVKKKQIKKFLCRSLSY